MKLLLVIDVADDAAENYKDFTVDYDLRGTPIDDEKVNESIKYVEDCPLRPLPEMKHISLDDTHNDLIYEMGWNACLDEITGETE